MDPRLANTSQQQLGAVAYSGFPVRKITQKLNNNSKSMEDAFPYETLKNMGKPGFEATFYTQRMSPIFPDNCRVPQI